MEATDFARAVARRAARDVGGFEIPANSNRGPLPDRYNSHTGAPLGSPYCAGANSTWIDEEAAEQGVELEFKKSAGAVRLWEKNPGLRIAKEDFAPECCPCVAIMDHGGGKGHAYLAVGFDPDTGKIQSIDPNSNPHGSREGGGIYALDIRSIDDAQLLGFIRIA